MFSNFLLLSLIFVSNHWMYGLTQFKRPFNFFPSYVNDLCNSQNLLSQILLTDFQKHPRCFCEISTFLRTYDLFFYQAFRAGPTDIFTFSVHSTLEIKKVAKNYRTCKLLLAQNFCWQSYLCSFIHACINPPLVLSKTLQQKQ